MATKKSQRIAYGAVPRADLLPEAQRAERRHRETLPKLLLAIVLSAALAGLIWGVGAAQVFFARQGLAAAETESADLTAQVSQFADEQKIIATVNQLSGAREGLAAFEVLFPDVLGEIAEVLPGDATVVRFTGELKARSEEQASVSSGLGGIDLNPLCVADSATVTIEVAGANLSPVPGFLRGLESVTGFKCIVATKVEIEEDGGPQKVTVQLALTEEALATRFEEAEE